ncbi:MAG: PVC-type heme-binding CxxCH protein [Pirellulales bacterium]
MHGKALPIAALVFAATAFAPSTAAPAADGNRLTYLDAACDPYYAGVDFPKLVTPQWVGDPGVEAVVTLGIDDMREIAPYETYLRPILERLKKIDGRAPLSIMTCQIDPQTEHLQKWLAEGVSIETHTADHPCPCLQGGDINQAKSTYDRCVDQIHAIPGHRPVAFRFPCMDSLNTPSPRAFVEILNRKTPQGNFLQASSSVSVILDADDPALPRELVLTGDGQGRFSRYAPFRSYVNKIHNYPYPFVISRKLWEFPCAVPDDWQAQNLQQPANPRTVSDLQAVIDAAVIKQGMTNIVFHPYDWLRNDQMVEVIDHVASKHGRKVKFLNFGECVARLTEHLLAGHPLRAADGSDNGVRLLDLNNDGYLDVVIGNDQAQLTRVWTPDEQSWQETSLPCRIVQLDAEGNRQPTGVRFGIMSEDGMATMLLSNGRQQGAWRFGGRQWVESPELLKGLDIDGEAILTSSNGLDRGVRLHDLDGDGACELLVANPQQSAALAWDKQARMWNRLPFALPEGAVFVDADGRDAGLRLVDIDEDGHDDVLFSDHLRYGLHLFESMERGWSIEARAGERTDADAIPMIVRAGTNNGAWFADRHLWIQNEDTNRLPDGVDRRSFNDLLGDTPPRARNAAAALRSLRVPVGFRVELVAAEPLVADPVALDWGPDGRLWVAEMADYPLGIDGEGTPGGRVRVLTDSNGDGRYDESSVFLEGLPYPTGVMAWRDGVLVVAAPEILFARDTDGDGRADERKTLYEGFSEGNQQHRVNGLRWGLDNWVYLANGDSGGRVRSVRTGEAVDIRGRDLRIRPDHGDVEAIEGQTQFGRSRDDWGNWFGGNNSNPVWHYALDDTYLGRNPHFAPPSLRMHISEQPGAAPVFPISRTLARFNDLHTADRFTSACSPAIYRDTLLGEPLVGNVFVCEPVHNLVHREVVEPRGVTFTARRAASEQEREFLSSSDNWFRPVMCRTGPDGALWVADMYRAVIEHPEWIPDDWQARLDLRAGHEQGRIYRVLPVGSRPRPIERLDRLTTEQLVARLESPNGTVRDLVSRTLLWRDDRRAVAPLERRATSSEQPLARLHAMCTLEGFSTLSESVLVACLVDKHAGVRRHAVRLAETRLGTSAKLQEAVLSLSDDPDPHVRLQLAYSLGEWDDARAAAALAKLLLRDADDQYLTAAAVSSLNRENIDGILTDVLAGAGATDAPVAVLETLLTQAAALGDADTLRAALTQATDAGEAELPAWKLRAVAAIVRAARRDRNADNRRFDEATRVRLDALLDNALQLVKNRGEADVERRIAAAALLGQDSRDDAATRLAVQQALVELVTPSHPPELQSAAIEALAALGRPEAAAALLSGWAGYTPSLRNRVLDAVLERESWTDKLLDAIEQGDVQATQLSAARRAMLLSHDDAERRRRAERLLAAQAPRSRDEVIAAHAPVLNLPGDRERGRTLFQKHCSACHQLEGVGRPHGPDLTALTDHSPQALLTAMLDPNRAIEDKFVSYIVATVDGRTLTGMLSEESSAAVTLVDQQGEPQTILRQDLLELRSTGQSLMPEGLEKDLAHADLADVIGYVRQVGPPPKSFDGNRPRTIEPDESGVLTLPASDARVYGSTVIFEPQYENLGYWSSADDRAAWSIQVTAPASYRVVLDFACHGSAAGNAFVLEAADHQLTGVVESTGTWDDYREQTIGRLQLAPGPQEIVFRSAGAVENALIDLRGIKLIPE